MAWMGKKSQPEPQPTPEISRKVVPPKQPQPAATTRKSPAGEAPRREQSNMQQKTAIVGQSVHIKGEMTGKEDLTIEGSVEGKITLPANSLTVGTNGRVAAEIQANTVEVLGQVHGNIVAVDMVTIAPSGSVQGDIRAPRVAIADGARFRGSVDMDTSGQAKGVAPQQQQQQQRTAKPEQQPVAAAS